MNGLRIGFLGLTFGAAVAPPASLQAPVAAQAQRQGSLHLHKFKYVMDPNGVVWLSVQFSHDGNKPITVIGVAPNRAGPWTEVKQTVAPGALVRGSIKIVKDQPSTVFVDCSEGIEVFALPSRK